MRPTEFITCICSGPEKVCLTLLSAHTSPGPPFIRRCQSPDKKYMDFLEFYISPVILYTFDVFIDSYLGNTPSSLNTYLPM